MRLEGAAGRVGVRRRRVWSFRWWVCSRDCFRGERRREREVLRVRVFFRWFELVLFVSFHSPLFLFSFLSPFLPIRLYTPAHGPSSSHRSHLPSSSTFLSSPLSPFTLLSNGGVASHLSYSRSFLPRGPHSRWSRISLSSWSYTQHLSSRLSALGENERRVDPFAAFLSTLKRSGLSSNADLCTVCSTDTLRSDTDEECKTTSEKKSKGSSKI